jgi:hypothetical protein
MEHQNLTRRSFVKKTTILSVAFSQVSLFSGLASAGTGYQGYLNKDCDDAKLTMNCFRDTNIFATGYACEVNCGTTADPENYYAWCADSYVMTNDPHGSRNIECKDYL